MMDIDTVLKPEHIIYVAGHNGMVGSAIVRNLKENCNLDDAVFLTSDAKKCNILFNLLDEDDK